MPILSALRQALRSLMRAPTFTFVALLTLALGVGANTAVFSVIKAVFLKPLPFAHPQDLAYIHVDSAKLFPGTPYLALSAPVYRNLREHQTVFTDVALFSYPQWMNLTGHGDAERVMGIGVTGSFFGVLGVQPALGRPLQPSDDGGPKVTVLTHAFWRNQFQGDPGIVGRVITLSGQGYTVVGVMPPRFRWQYDPQFFTADGPTQEQYREQWTTWIRNGIGRLKPGLTLALAQADLSRVHGGIARENPRMERAPLLATDFWTFLYGDQRAKGLLLGLTGGLVLLIACANLANLMVSRADHRQRELALRRALGGTWRDGLKPFLAEGCLVALGGGSLGLLLALGLSRFLLPFIPDELQGVAGLDASLLLYAFGTALAIALLCGFAPGLLASRLNLVADLRQASQSTPSPRQGWIRNSLVMTQVALSLTLLVGFAALFQSLRKLDQAPLGYQPDRALSFVLTPDPQQYPLGSARAAFVREVMQTLADMPGVTRVGVTNQLPLDYGGKSSYTLPGREELNLTAFMRDLGPGCAETLGMIRLRGRDFVGTDCTARPNSIQVSRSLAARCWPGEDPIGKSLTLGDRPVEVVGLMEDVRHEGPRMDRDLDTIYFPDDGGQLSSSRIVIRTTGSPTPLVPAIRDYLRQLDPNLPLQTLQPLRARLDLFLEGDRTQAQLLGLLASIALCLAAAGIYGVMAYTINQRTREIGIRKALGAQDWQVVWEITRRGLILVAFGLGLGALLTLGTGGFLKTFVYGVTAQDPLFMAFAAAVLGFVALAAAAIPASRAARAEPSVSLRTE